MFGHFSTLSTAQKMKSSIKDFFSICDQIRRKLRIWSHLLKKPLIENFIFCAVMHERLTPHSQIQLFLKTFQITHHLLKILCLEMA